MAELIGDGYDCSVEHDGFRFEYRPLPAGRRDFLAQRLIKLSGAELLTEVVNLCNDRLIKQSVPLPIARREGQLALLWSIVSGSRDAAIERADEWNLRAGIQTLERFPHLTTFSCDDCRTYWIDIQDGEVARHPQTKESLTREGPPPCEIKDLAIVCPIGHWQKPRRLSEKNRLALEHYHECRAVGQFPDDPLVRRHARVIEWGYAVAKEYKCQNSRR